MSGLAWVGVAVLGSGGALARFLLDGFTSSRFGHGFPLGTLVVNVSGSLVLGFLVGASVTGTPLVLAGTATLGSFTTFSTWMFETQRLRENGEFARAGFNVVASLLAGVGAAALGRVLG